MGYSRNSIVEEIDVVDRFVLVIFDDLEKEIEDSKDVGNFFIRDFYYLGFYVVMVF